MKKILILSALTASVSNVYALDFFKSNKQLVIESSEQLQTVYNIGLTIEQINMLRDKTNEIENKLSKDGYDLKKNLTQSLEDEKQKEKLLINKLIDSINNEIKELKLLISLKNNKVNELTKSLNADLNVLSYIVPASKYAFGYLDGVKNFFVSADENAKLSASRELINHQNDLELLSKKLSDKQKTSQDIASGITSAELAAIKFSIMSLKKILNNAENTLKNARKQDIFDVYNDNADILLKNLNMYIAAARCNLIKSIGDAKDVNIKACAKKNIDLIKSKTKNNTICQRIGEYNLNDVKTQFSLILNCANTVK